MCLSVSKLLYAIMFSQLELPQFLLSRLFQDNFILYMLKNVHESIAESNSYWKLEKGTKEANTESKCIVKIKPLNRHNCKTKYVMHFWNAYMVRVSSCGSEPRHLLKKRETKCLQLSVRNTYFNLSLSQQQLNFNTCQFSTHSSTNQLSLCVPR